MWSCVFIFQYDLPQHIGGYDVIQRFFWGINASHILFTQNFARRSSLTNISFRYISFPDFLKNTVFTTFF